MAPVRATDLRVTTWPPSPLVQERLAAHDPQAVLVTIWESLLGTAGSALDLSRARDLYDAYSDAKTEDPLWSAAGGLIAWRDSRDRKEATAALRRLSVAADRGIVEARYWMGIAYLDARGPTYDPRLGVQALLKAQEQGHAHAALALGEMFLTGQGVPHDITRARQSFTNAVAYGLPEARARLDAISPRTNARHR